MLKKSTIIVIVIIIVILLCIILYNYYKNDKNKQAFKNINEHFNNSSDMYAMASDDQNRAYYAVIPANVTSSTPINWIPNGMNIYSISISNNFALSIDGGRIWYTLTPAIWKNSAGNTNWIPFASSPTGKGNTTFKTVSLDGYKRNAMASDEANNAYYAVIPANLSPSTALTWIPKGVNIYSISISNNLALSIDGGRMWYTLTPAIWKDSAGNTNWKVMESIPENIKFKTVSFDGYKMTAMATDDQNKIYYARIPPTPPQALTWTHVGNVTNSVAISNNVALCVDTIGDAWYTLDPAVWYNGPTNNWKKFASNPTGIKFKTISLDNNQSTSPTATQAPANLVLMGIGTEMVIGATTGAGNGGTIYYADQNIVPSTPLVAPNYTVCPGTLQQLSVSNKQMYGLINGYVYYHPNYKNITTPTWVLLTNRALSHVSFDGYNMIVMGVGAVAVANGATDGKIYYADQNVNTTTPLWVQVPSTLVSGATITSAFKKISCSNKQAFAITNDGNIYYRENYKTGNWVNTPGSLIDISFDGYNMTVVGIDFDGRIVYADQNITTVPNWTYVPSTLFPPPPSLSATSPFSNGGIQQISISNNQIMGVNTTSTTDKGKLYYRANYKTGDWVKILGGLHYVSFDDTTPKLAPTTTQTPTTTKAPTTTQVPTTTSQFPITTSQFPITTSQSPTTTQAPTTTSQFPITTSEFPITTSQFPITTQDPLNTQVPTTTSTQTLITTPESILIQEQVLATSTTKASTPTTTTINLALLNQTLTSSDEILQNERYNIINNQETLYDISNRLNNLNLKLKTLNSTTTPNYSTTGELTFY